MYKETDRARHSCYALSVVNELKVLFCYSAAVNSRLSLETGSPTTLK